MGRRGPRPLPDQIKLLKGNPGRRRLALESASQGWNAAVKTAEVPVPAFLRHPRELEIFRAAVELMRWISHAPDVTALGRWATYLHLWICEKENLGALTDETAGSPRRKSPQFRVMCDLERVLLSLENRLGLNPVARQNICRGLWGLAAVTVGEPVPEEKAAASPLGFLSRATKPKLN